MKKKIFLLFSLFFIFNNVSALTGYTNLNCNKSVVTVGDTISCTVSFTTTSGGINGFSNSISLSNLDLVSSSKDSSWSGDASGGKFGVYTDTSKNGTVSIGTITLKASSVGSGTITLSGITASDEDYNDVYLSNVSKTITIEKAKSTDNSLQSLSLSNGTLSPAFSPSVTSYTATIDSSSTTISVVAPLNGSVSGYGEKTLNYGDNTFTITSTSESGSSKNYVIVIKRPNNTSTNTNTNTKTSTSTNNSNTTNTNTKTNTNTTVVQTKSDNNYLKSLSVVNYELDFNKDTLEYTINVENEVKEVEILASQEDSKASITGTGIKSLDSNNNKFEVVVTSESGNTKTYVINVNKNKEEDTYLIKDVAIDNVNIGFDENINEYTVKTEKDSIEIKYNANENVDVKILNNENLVNGSVVKLVVSKDDVTKEYSIKIVKEETKKELSKSKILFLVMLLLVIILLILYIIDKFNKNKKISKGVEKVITPVIVSKNKRIIGFKNLTEHAGSTSLIYMIKRYLDKNLNVCAIEIDKDEFKYFEKDNMFSVSSFDFNSEIDSKKDYSVILVDLNDYTDYSKLDEVVYLLEPSTLKFNKLAKNHDVVKYVKDKKVILNKCNLKENVVKEFEYEINQKLFAVIPSLDDRVNNEVINDLIYKLEIYRNYDK